MDLTPEPPFERGEMLTAERVEAVLLAAAQDAVTASPDWTGGFRVPVSRWLTTLSETIEHGAAATDEHHGALALANLILRGPYRAGREDAARLILDEFEIMKNRAKDITDRKASACARVGLSMAALKVIEMSDRWAANQQPRTVKQGDGDSPEEQQP